MQEYSKNIIKFSLILIGVSSFTGFLIGSGWAIWGDYKGSAWTVIFILTAAGSVLGLPMVSFLILETKCKTLKSKLMLSVIPLVIISCIVPVYGGLLFFQLFYIFMPAFLTRKSITAFLGSIAGGVGFLMLWFVIHKLKLIRYSDDVFIVFPFIIVLVSIELGIAKFIINKYFIENGTVVLAQ